MQDRILSEKEYHNYSFSSHNREKIDTYYVIIDNINFLYHKYLLDEASGKSILEYGCGLGSKAFDLAKAGADITGIDISETGIEIAEETAKKLNLNCNFQVMNAEKTDFPNQSFDIICGSGIIHHLDLNLAYPELNRLLKKDGFALFTEPLGHNPFLNLYRLMTPDKRTKDEHPLKMTDIKELYKYFHSVEVIYTAMLTPLAIPFINKRIYTPIYNFLNSIEKGIMRFFPFMKRYCWYSLIKVSQPK